MCCNPASMNPPGLNPHCGITALDPPRFGARPDDEPPRRWKCNYCPVQGTIDELNILTVGRSAAPRVDESRGVDANVNDSDRYESIPGRKPKTNTASRAARSERRRTQ